MGFLGLIALLTGLACVAATNVIELNPDGSETYINSPGSPHSIPPNTKDSWEIRSPPGTKVRFYCYEIKLSQDNSPNCDENLMTIEGGEEKREICGHHLGLSVLSADNWLSVKLMTGPKGSDDMFACVSRTYTRHITTTPTSLQQTKERVELEAGGNPYPFNSHQYPNNPADYIRQDWHFETAPGSTVRITCHDLRLTQRSDGTCGDAAVTVTDGVNTRVLCGQQSGFTMLSSSNTMEISFTSGMYGRGGFNCSAQGRIMDWYGELTTTTSTIPPYLGIESEEVDSGEHGGAPGHVPTNCNCGWANKAQPKVVNGVETNTNEFPFMAALIDKNGQYQFCGGSIVTRYHVVTAAHCTIKHLNSGKPMAVVIGDHNLYVDEETNSTKTIDVARIIQHEDYLPSTLKHDISLLLLAEEIEFNRRIGPVCLSPVILEIPRQYVKIVGWGHLQWGGPAPDVLQKVDVRVLHRNTCHKVFYIVDDVNPTQICTYSSKKASCQGDSGGPVVWLDPDTNRYVLVGIVSFGTICADENPSVHTDAPAYYDWIQKNIKESMPLETCSKVG